MLRHDLCTLICSWFSWPSIVYFRIFILFIFMLLDIISVRKLIVHFCILPRSGHTFFLNNLYLDLVFRNWIGRIGYKFCMIFSVSGTREVNTTFQAEMRSTKWSVQKLKYLQWMSMNGHGNHEQFIVHNHDKVHKSEVNSPWYRDNLNCLFPRYSKTICYVRPL